MNNKTSRAWEKHNRKLMEDSREGDLNRARSICIGTAFGGVVEVSMRTNTGRSIWVVLQPAEVIELIHQLSASVGCRLALTPREDFASWRKWNENNLGAQHAPHPSLPEPNKQLGFKPAMMARSESNEQTVATEKTVGRKRAKRAAAPA